MAGEAELLMPISFPILVKSILVRQKDGQTDGQNFVSTVNNCAYVALRRKKRINWRIKKIQKLSDKANVYLAVKCEIIYEDSFCKYMI